MRTTLPRYPVLLLILVLVSVFIAPVIPLHAQSNVEAVVTAGTVNLRSGPGLDFSGIAAAKAGDSFPVLGRAHGSNRVWYKVQLPSGGTAWISERVVNVYPSADNVPWLSDNVAKTPLIMDCGEIPPVLFVGTYAEVTKVGGLELTTEPGLGKTRVGTVPQNELVKVLDGPFCTRLADDFYQMQWRVQTGAGTEGYLYEGRPDGKGNYIPYTQINGQSGLAPSSTDNTANSAEQDVTERPTNVSDDDIQQVIDTFHAVQFNQLDETETQDKLQAFVDDDDNDTVALAWIVRHVPIYDGKTRRWESFARYEDQNIMDWRTDSQLDNDPATVATDILFGNYKDNDHLWGMMGCGGV